MTTTRETTSTTGATSLGETGHVIWLAGLGALSEMERTGRRLFDELVERGRRVERRQLKAVDRAVADGSRRAERLGDEVRDKLHAGVDGMLHRAHLPTRTDLKELSALLDRLSERIETLSD